MPSFLIEVPHEAEKIACQAAAFRRPKRAGMPVPPALLKIDEKSR